MVEVIKSWMESNKLARMATDPVIKKAKLNYEIAKKMNKHETIK